MTYWNVSVLRKLIALITCAMMLPSLALATDKAEFVRGSNAFAYDLYAKLKTEKGNLFFSPQSIALALAMTYGGARTSTEIEMAKVMHFTLPSQKLDTAAAAFITDLNAGGKGGDYQLAIANALWLEKDFVFKPEFIKRTNTSYGAGIHFVSFKTAAEAVRGSINSWVEDKTAGKIKELIPAGAIDNVTRMVLTNAIYFKGSWDKAFDKSYTQDGDFHLSASQAILTPMIQKHSDFNYFDGGSFQMIELPYKGDRLSMVIFLPKTVDGLPALERIITPINMQKWLENGKLTPNVFLILPKFKIGSWFQSLEDVFKALGMTHAFTDADFSGMADPKDNHDQGLYISKIIHKAYIDVNEEGTEAAAATAVTMPMGAIYRKAPPSPEVHIDHPFFFIIRDKNSGAILFMGRITDPSKQGDL